jgi:hypothetical protein
MGQAVAARLVVVVAVQTERAALGLPVAARLALAVFVEPEV